MLEATASVMAACWGRRSKPGNAWATRPPGSSKDEMSSSAASGNSDSRLGLLLERVSRCDRLNVSMSDPIGVVLDSEPDRLPIRRPAFHWERAASLPIVSATDGSSFSASSSS